MVYGVLNHREVLRRHVAARFTDYLHAFIINSAYGGIYPKFLLNFEVTRISLLKVNEHPSFVLVGFLT